MELSGNLSQHNFLLCNSNVMLLKIVVLHVECRIEEVSRMLSHADSLRTLNGTFWKP